MRSLIRAGVDLSARGIIATEYRRGQQQLSPGRLQGIGDELISRLGSLSWRDKGNVRTIVAEQDRAVRAARRVNDPAIGWADGRSIPLTHREPADFAGKRFRATVVVETVDPITGQRSEGIFHFRTDERVTFSAIQQAILSNQQGPTLEQYDTRTGLPARATPGAAIRVISVERLW